MEQWCQIGAIDGMKISDLRSGRRWPTGAELGGLHFAYSVRTPAGASAAKPPLDTRPD
jgi:hypothetical protein